MFNIDQNIDDTGPSGSVEIQDEQGVVSPSDSPSPAVSELPQVVVTPVVHDPSMTADNALTQPQSDQQTDAVVHQNAIPTRDQLPSLITPAQLSVELHPNLVMSAPPPITFTSPGQDNHPSPVHSQPTTINPSLLMAPVSPNVPISAGGSNLPSSPNPRNLFNSSEVVQAPTWMKKKGTLEYFNSAFKTEDLSGLISNWFKLERALGFPEQVSFVSQHLTENVLTFRIR